MSELLNMSFYNGTLDKPKASTILKSTNKPLKYRYGFGYRGAKANDITLENALEIVEKESLLDITETENDILLNAYSCNDMF